MAKHRRRWLPLLLAPPALIAILLNTWDFVGLWVEHDKAVEESGEQCQGLAREVSRFLTGTLKAVEIHLTDHLKPAAELLLAGKAKPGLQRAFQLTAKRLPLITEVLIFDRGGHLLESSQRARRPGLEIGDAPFFLRHAVDGADLTVFVVALDGLPPESRAAKWQLHMAGSLHGEDGGFAGIVVAALDTETIFGTIGEMKIPTGTSVRVFDGQGRLLINQPRDFTQIGRSFADTKLLRAWRTNPTDRVGRLPDPTDDSPEIGAFRMISRYPILVSVGIAEDLALAEWWRELAILLGTVTIVLLASGWTVRHSLARWVLRARGGVPAPGFRDGDGI